MGETALLGSVCSSKLCSLLVFNLKDFILFQFPLPGRTLTQGWSGDWKLNSTQMENKSTNHKKSEKEIFTSLGSGHARGTHTCTPVCTPPTLPSSDLIPQWNNAIPYTFTGFYSWTLWQRALSFHIAFFHACQPKEDES